MPISVRVIGKFLSHKIFGPGGYTRIAYKFRFAIKSTILKMPETGWFALGLKSSRSAFVPEYNVVDAATKRFYDADNAHRDLRRDIHRLEKGITAQNQRKVFGLEPCTGVIAALEQEPCRDRATLTWAYSVLSKYWVVLDEVQNKTLDDLQRRFEALKAGGAFENALLEPYRSYSSNSGEWISLEELIVSRRSVRRFSSRSIDRMAIERALKLAINAPTACNRVPYRFVLLDQIEKITNIGNLAGGTAGWLDNIPCLVVVVGDWSAYSDTNDRHTPFIDSSYAVMQFLLKLHQDGMGGCVINWKNDLDNDRKLRELLKLEAWEQAITLVAIGYPETADVPMSIKKDCGSILTWNN